MPSPWRAQQNAHGRSNDNNKGYSYAGAEQTPLRRRENDSAQSSSSYGVSDLPSPYHRTARRHSLLENKDSLLQWTMRGVLLSPVIVLVIWSAVAVTFHRSQTNVASVSVPQTTAVPIPVRPKKELTAPAAGAVYREFPSQADSGSVVYREFPSQADSSGAVYREFPSQGDSGKVYREFPSQGDNGSVVYREFPSQGANSGAVYREFPSQGDSSGAVYREFPSQGANSGAVYREFPSQGDSSGAVYREFPSQGDNSNVVYRDFPTAAIASESRDLGPAVGESVYREFPAQGTSLMKRAETAGEGVLEVVEAALGSSPDKDYIPIIAPLGSRPSDNTMIVQPPGLGVGHAMMTSQPALTATHQMHRPNPRGSSSSNNNDGKGKVQIFYYNPAQAIQADGQLVVPSTVYDSTGRAVSTKSLGAREILLEPPMGVTPIRNSSGNETITNFIHPNVISDRVSKKTMTRLGSVSTMAAVVSEGTTGGGSGTLADQSIIIGTVGVMALLVGAVTARRLRSRNILSACIENEALEDDIAYDTAYTVNSDSYNTFSQGWKGDLEKFDV